MIMALVLLKPNLLVVRRHSEIANDVMNVVLKRPICLDTIMLLVFRRQVTSMLMSIP